MMADYCTLWPDRLLGVDFSTCCLRHDLDYIAGVGRWHADQALAACVAHAGLPFTGFVMGAGVGLFGWLFYRRRK